MTTAQKSALEAKKAARSARVDAAKAKAASVRGYGSGFFAFIREQGVICLSVGLAIGAAAGASVKSIVDNLISPLVALLTQGVNLNNLKWVLMDKTTTHAEVAIGWGAVLSSLITLGATALIIYLVVKVAKLDRLDKKKDAS
jgi:large conductance mechanosensitive channel